MLSSSVEKLASAKSKKEVREALQLFELDFSRAGAKVITESEITANPKLQPEALQERLDAIRKAYPHDQEIRVYSAKLLVRLMGQAVTSAKLRRELENRTFRLIGRQGDAFRKNSDRRMAEQEGVMDTLKEVVRSFDLSESGVSKLIRYANDKKTDYFRRIRAIEVLGNLKSRPDKARDTLLAIAKSHKVASYAERHPRLGIGINYRYQLAALDALRHYDDLKTMRGLMALVRNTKESDQIRAAAFDALVGYNVLTGEATKTYNGKPVSAIPAIQAMIARLARARSEDEVVRHARKVWAFVDEGKPRAGKLAQQSDDDSSGGAGTDEVHRAE